MLQKMKNTRLERTFEVLAAFNPYIAKEVFATKKLENMPLEVRSAIRIQRVYRGYVARKAFAKILFEYYQKLEEEEIAIRNKQVEEGLRAIQAKAIEEEIDTKEFLERQRKLRRESSAITIQRHFRKHLKDPKRIPVVQCKKVDKYEKYREMLKTPVKLVDDDSDNEDLTLDPTLESSLAKAAGVDIKKSKTMAQKTAEEDEKTEKIMKGKEIGNLENRYNELLKQVDDSSEKLKKALLERAELLAALDE